MYSIQKTSFGYYVLLEGIMDDSQFARLRDELQCRLAGVVDSYSAIVDIRKLVPPRSEGLATVGECVKIAFATGMQRIAVIYTSPVLRDMIRQIAFVSGRDPVGRYIDASKLDNAVQLAVDYVEQGIEPPVTTQKIRIIAE